MGAMHKIVKQAITSGFLSIEAENQLRQLLRNKYDREDFTAFMTLQAEAMEGRVKQESRQLVRSKALENQDQNLKRESREPAIAQGNNFQPTSRMAIAS
ncbi:MAG: hypothetical protein SAL07_03785 [Oscillatoria sp. PMC 1051.18]|uniref:hypothetical protein n=1 Tax=Oscillatoria salina TaxID=331517 RepID=UPI0013B776AA|nr:hypothetical protein [Oscillatoria salina]MBZ8181284.1 hypothetical protein [Oscillatoria salina IIICB1]MEC4892072.1 hypothetical protein [Oscillatoria sp. PMC 1050.18]MEC5029012.1 hypothetical protein [Oscillatoria sp. PMC 1051.18]NET86849.1 hypothetical protein [Kamptonema sp. SIO1D9]